MQYPKQSTTVHMEKLDGELCIYDWQRKEVHNLNPIAAQVWQLCDGQTMPQQMAAQLHGDLTPAQAEELVWLTLKRLEQAHLLENKVVKPTGRKVYTRREMLTKLGVAALMLPVVSTIVAPSPVEAQSPGGGGPVTGSQTFNFTGTAQTFIVPAGVTSVTIDANGAQGGSGRGGTVGALGGRVVATITVTSGETLDIYVGGQGETPTGQAGGSGGFNGGASGGSSGIAGATSGGGGGGASDVRRGATALLVVAGGGGGDGGSGGAGGVGGGLTGGSGADSTEPARGGGGGTQLAGGSGGAGGNAAADGTDGASGNGGAGGSALAIEYDGGGGGGGGYYGGGGGEASATSAPGFGAGGGGGGSSFPSGGTHTQGVRSGDGEVTISW